MSSVSSGTISTNGCELDPVLGGLVGREAQRDAARAGDLHQRADGARGLARPPVGDDAGGAHHASTSSDRAGARALGQPQERLLVAGRAGERGRRAAEDGGAVLARGGGDVVDDLAPQLRVLDHAALADPLAADLELRLDHRQAVERARPWSRGPPGRTLRQGDEGDVDDDQIRAVREVAGRDRAGVGALDHGHALVLAQAVVELAVGDVERDHVGGAALEQAVGEAAGGRADVQRATAREVDPQRVERVGELDAAAGDVGRRPFDLELDRGVDQLARLLGPAPAGAEVDLARDHGGGGAGPRLEQPAFRQ